MRYLGSKYRIAKKIVPIMLEYRKEGQWWVEPFVGGGNTIAEVIAPRRLGSDINHWAIEALRAIRDFVEYLPKDSSEFTEEDYKALRYSDEYPYKGYAGFALSYGGKWLGGYAKGNAGRDYVAEAFRHAVKQSKKLQNVVLYCCDYRDLYIPHESIIYCDIPYKNTTKYATNDFDYNEFYNWCIRKRKDGHTIFVSEYEMPKDFKCIFEIPLNKQTCKKNGKYEVAIERLFTLD